MAVGALAFEVIFWSSVAGLTIGEAIMVKVRPVPGAGRMTTGALPLEVVGRTVVRVARLAIGLPAVIEISWLPGIGRVAG